MFKVKAVYDYSSPHEDDLSFQAGQIITVIEEEGDDWYVGEYTDDAGTRHDGLFPTNFVEKYEPAPPPRPVRAVKSKPVEQPQAQIAPEVTHHEPELVPQSETELAPLPPAEVPPTAKAEPLPMSPTSSPFVTVSKQLEIPQTQPETSKSTPAVRKAPPPVAAKSNAFRDRIAAFNAPAAAPIQPFKPGGGSTTFIKKPFVAPPPSRNAYVPPPPRETVQIKTYRREEDPEIVARQAQDQEAAEKAGLVAHDAPVRQEGLDEDQPKPTSLKERIALLQKQQQEQAERAATMHKEKSKRLPAKKRTESHEAHADDSEDIGLDTVSTGASRDRMSMDTHNRHRDLSDANDADQSGAGETEDAEGESTSVEEVDDPLRQRQPPPPPRAAAAARHEVDVGDEQDVEEAEEEEEDDEMDAETRRKMELRERMAKMSGGMGMAGMFGGMPMGGLPPKKKKPAPEKRLEEDKEYSMPQQRVAMFGMPGIAPIKSPELEDRQLGVEHEGETNHPIFDAYSAHELPDVEDMTPHPIQRTSTGERPPPIPSDKRPLPPPVPAISRPVPPPLPDVTSPGPGSESGDEMTDGVPGLPSPKAPSAPFASPSPKRSSYIASDDRPLSSGSRRVPSFPIASPSSLPSQRAPPPLPPAHPPSRPVDKTEGETDYEGDYDTDITPGQAHKEALKFHTREPSIDGSITTDEPSAIRHVAPSLPPAALRGAPPSPQPSRQSIDAPRSMPPLPPVLPPSRIMTQDDDDDYDPYKYTGLIAAPLTPRAAPPPPRPQSPPQARPPPPMPPSVPPVPQHRFVESDDDGLYCEPPPSQSHARPPPPPPQAPPHQYAPPPPPPQERFAPLPPPSHDWPVPPLPPSDTQPRVSIGKKSLDINRSVGRTSIDHTRPVTNQDFIASDIDLGVSSHWWTQSRLLPPSLQSRKDVLIDMKESQSGSSVEKTISILYQDYSQTTISAIFDTSNVSNVQLEQRHDPPPPHQRPDQLEGAYEQFGRRIAKDVEAKQNTIVGSGTPHSLIEELLKPHALALAPVSTRSFGALVYANLANASTQSYDEIRPGDIISFRNAKFQGKTGAMHAKYSVDVGKPDHVGVVVEWDGSKKKVRVWEQGREHKKVKPESFKMGDLRSGEVRVWRVVSKAWVGWD